MTAHWPRADGSTVISARCKTHPEDFRVSERLQFDPTGSGEHLYLRIEKTGCTSLDVAGHLARVFGVRRDDIGIAGMKDKWAVTEQWFSIPAGADAPAELPEPEAAGRLRVLAATRHPKKLRRGQLVGNSFQLRLRDLSNQDCGAALERLRRDGAPNYFGSQRFGRDNLAAATSWLSERRQRRVSAFRKGLYLSVLRSFLFNEVLAARVAAGNWSTPIDGDVLEGDFPTGPLWGRGRSPAGASAAALEAQALEQHQSICDGLEHAGVSQQRRSLVLMPEQLSWQQKASDVTVSFTLPAGGYATSLLAEVFDLTMVDQHE